jgi:hypothetical protein
MEMRRPEIELPAFLPDPGRETKSSGFDYFPLKINVRYNEDSNAGDTEAEVIEEKTN